MADVNYGRIIFGGSHVENAIMFALSIVLLPSLCSQESDALTKALSVYSCSQQRGTAAVHASVLILAAQHSRMSAWHQDLCQNSTPDMRGPAWSCNCG